MTETLRHPGKSGIYPLENPHDAFAARMLLAQAARRKLDVQYYIWRAARTGTLLLEVFRAIAGIELYEMRCMEGRAGPGKAKGPFGSSGSSLHAKAFAIDGRRVFVGLFNFDPRSANLNTELGFVIDSPGLAGRIENAFENRIPAGSYQVHLDENGNLYWLEQQGEKQIRHEKEPNPELFKRAFVYLLSLLPIEWML